MEVADRLWELSDMVVWMVVGVVPRGRAVASSVLSWLSPCPRWGVSASGSSTSMCSHCHPCSEHRQVLDVGSMVARLPMAWSAVAALSRLNCSRVWEAAWGVGYGGDVVDE